jgi:hypothetical protein
VAVSLPGCLGVLPFAVELHGASGADAFAYVGDRGPHGNPGTDDPEQDVDQAVRRSGWTPRHSETVILEGVRDRGDERSRTDIAVAGLLRYGVDRLLVAGRAPRRGQVGAVGPSRY